MRAQSVFSRRGENRWTRVAPGAAVLLVLLLAGLSFASTLIVARHFQDEARSVSRLYSEIYLGLTDQSEAAAVNALLDLAVRVTAQGIPLVLTDSAGGVVKTANTRFAQTPDDPKDAELQRYVTMLDRVNPPLVVPGGGKVHYGPVPSRSLLTTLGVLQALTIVIMAMVGWFAYRSATIAQRDRLWVAMAREAAHQMGTPLTSVQGWIEHLRGEEISRNDIADHLMADSERLQRVANRFERIGNPARKETVQLGALSKRVAGYFRPRLPRHANPILLQVNAPGTGPGVPGDPVLLEWVLEVLIKNAIDALQGRGGTINLSVTEDADGAVLRVSDDGPGVPRELRRHLFEAGSSSKRGGWGIGLALARRVVEDAHGGSITYQPLETGTAFLIKIPLHSGKPAT